MCLTMPAKVSDLSRTEKLHYKDRIGWKVFKKLNFNSSKDKFTFQYQSVLIKHIPRRRWLKASEMKNESKEKLNYSLVSDTYWEGFHIFLSYKDALFWGGSQWNGPYGPIIKKVKFGGYTSLGYHVNGAFTYGDVSFCVVADEMLVI